MTPQKHTYEAFIMLSTHRTTPLFHSNVQTLHASATSPHKCHTEWQGVLGSKPALPIPFCEILIKLASLQ